MDIAIVGIGCRFPGRAYTPQAFWELLCSGVDAISDVPADRFDVERLFDRDPGKPGKLYTRWGGFLDRIDAFDADFFGISPREARRIDPQQRLLLETAWEALEDAGQSADRLAGSNAGVFVGISSNEYGNLQLSRRNAHLIDAHAPAGGALCIAANRVSYCLDLHGPSLAVDTACSSSLTALHLAVQSLSREECGLAIAAGVNVLLAPELTIGFCKASMLSPDGRCRPFAANANGYVRSEGAGAVALKPLRRALEERDPIRAVIVATGVNQDGRTAGISVPSAAAQKALLRRTLRNARMDAGDVQYVEAHGTGTPVGDPREADAIGSVYGRGRPAERPCLIGSVKGNIGHLEAAAGMAGLIKTVLALEHRRIPPSLHFVQGNPAIPFDGLRLRVVTELETWPDVRTPAVAAVNSFGFGGANAHAIVTEAPARAPTTRRSEGESSILAISARAPKALHELAQSYAALLGDAEAPHVGDVCHSAATRRSHHEHRLAVVARSRAELAARLAAHVAGDPLPDVATGRHAKGTVPKLAFVFPGMGPQRWGMGRELLEDGVFRRAMEHCDALLRPLAGWSLLDEFAADEATSRIADADRAHVANFALQVALAALLRSWGVVPDAVVGHSSGEMAAACVAGALSLSDALHLAFHRGRLQHRASGTGGMLAAGIPAQDAADLIKGCEDRVSLAAINGPASITLSGEIDTLTRIADSLAREGRFCRQLAVRVPYHGPQMEASRTELLDALAGLDCRKPTIPICSTTTGAWIDGLPLDAEYWWRNVRQPVLFAHAMDQLTESRINLFLELGPHPVLAPAMLECLAGRDKDAVVLPTLRRNDGERHTLLRSVAALYARGRNVDWTGVLGSEHACVRLPLYPWQRERHWFESAHESDDGAAQRVVGPSVHPLLGRRLPTARPTWEADLGGVAFACFDGHQIAGTATFPGAAYVETALAAADAIDGSEHGARSLEDIEFRRLLPLADRNGRLLQCTVDDNAGTIEIHSARADSPEILTLHAGARLVHARPATRHVELERLRARCPRRVDVDAFYRAAERRGLRYDGMFRTIAELWQGDGEALARVGAPPDVLVDGYRVHPGLLDSAFQALVVALAAGDWSGLSGRGPLVVTRIDRVTAWGTAGPSFWSHVSAEATDSALTGHVRLFDESGSELLACERLQLKVLDEGNGSSADFICQEVWERVARLASSPAHAGLRAPRELAATVAPDLARYAAEAAFDDYYRDVEPTLNAMTVRAIRVALRDLGWRDDDNAGGDVHSLADRLGIVPTHRRLFERLLAIATTGHAPAEPRLPERQDVRSGVQLVQESGARLARTLRGDEDARDWLVVGEAAAALSHFYSSTPWGVFYNRTLAEVVAAACPPGRKLRILELGAGTGATTHAILGRLPDAIAEYVFTDVSPFFLKHARDRFGPPARIRFEVLDIEQEPIFESGFDVVVAADVVHATADVGATLAHVQRLLAPGGLLVLLELTRRAPWLDIVFGQLEGWWRFAGRDSCRTDHPLLASAQWQQTLGAAGFDEVAQLRDAPPDGGEAVQTILLAQASRTATSPRGSAPQRRWLILADHSDIASRVAAELRGRGDHCTLVRPAPAYRRLGPDSVEVVATSADHWRRLLDELGSGPPVALVHLWALDAPKANGLATTSLMRFQDRSCGSVVALMQATRGGRDLGDVWIATSGAQSVGRDLGCANPAQSPVWGLGRVLRNELGGRRCRLIDLGEGRSREEVESLVDELRCVSAQDGEHELAFRGAQRFVRRLRRASLGPLRMSGARRRFLAPTSPFRLDVGSPGALETLVLREAGRRCCERGEVTIKVAAAGLNFRDVLMALGLMGTSSGSQLLGLECAGVVLTCPGSEDLHPGDEVIALANGGLASEVVTRADVVVRKPPGLTFEEAATLPVAFTTARYALQGLARIERGERALIHSASGGVGLAAVQLCQRVGAEVFATAGTPDKRAYVASLGVAHVMDSRSLDFADAVLERTGGEGVDVVLNSLAGEARTKSLALLRAGGRFIDMAVREILRDAPLRLRPFEKGLSYFTLGDVLPALRPRMGAVLQTVVSEIGAGTLEPLPHTAFDLADAEQGFRLMARAGHVGKIVLTVNESRYPVECAQPAIVHEGATYLITGGLGGFALAVAHWLVRRGARHIVLMSRTGVPHAKDVPALQALRASTAEVVVMRGDVADRVGLRRLLARIRTDMPPLKGVFHAAMTLDDDLLGRLDQDRFRAVLAPKVAGGWNLHELTRIDELDHFVLFSSGSSLIGIPAQSNYAAANAFLDGLALHRRALGLPGLAVNWGAITEAGYVARHPELRERLFLEGIESIGADDACAALEHVLRHDTSRVAIARIDWNRWTDGTSPTHVVNTGRERQASSNAPADRGSRSLLAELVGAEPAARAALVERHLVQCAASVLDADPARVEPERSLTDMGLDSLMAVELQNAVRRDLGVDIPLVEVLDGMTLRQLGDTLLGQISRESAQI